MIRDSIGKKGAKLKSPYDKYIRDTVLYRLGTNGDDTPQKRRFKFKRLGMVWEGTRPKGVAPPLLKADEYDEVCGSPVPFHSAIRELRDGITATIFLLKAI